MPIGGQTALGSETAEPGDNGPVALADAPDEEGLALPAAPGAEDDPPAADDPAPDGAPDPAPGPAPAPTPAPTPDPSAPAPAPAPAPTPTPEPDDDRLLAGVVDEPVCVLTGLTGDVLLGTG
ncbi:MAG: hypothetical protein H0X56_09065, partial [Solirubrobacterales bacterium]|nr:hypothetical protein [Solirubrobacterales bacterium]